jgi:hypothetical protein
MASPPWVIEPSPPPATQYPSSPVPQGWETTVARASHVSVSRLIHHPEPPVVARSSSPIIAQNYPPTVTHNYPPINARSQPNPAELRPQPRKRHTATRKPSEAPNTHQDENFDAASDMLEDQASESQSQVVSRQWPDEDTLLLLDWMSENTHNYEEFKVNPGRIADRIAAQVLGGRRTGEAVRAKWEALKKKHHTATLRLRSTGEGQRKDEDKWAHIKLGWLDKMCPNYELIDDVLQRYGSSCRYYEQIS